MGTTKWEIDFSLGGQDLVVWLPGRFISRLG